jgi:hypothetical protein
MRLENGQKLKNFDRLNLQGTYEGARSFLDLRGISANTQFLLLAKHLMLCISLYAYTWW